MQTTNWKEIFKAAPGARRPGAKYIKREGTPGKYRYTYADAKKDEAKLAAEYHEARASNDEGPSDSVLVSGLRNDKVKRRWSAADLIGKKMAATGKPPSDELIMALRGAAQHEPRMTPQSQDVHRLMVSVLERATKLRSEKGASAASNKVHGSAREATSAVMAAHETKKNEIMAARIAGGSDEARRKKWMGKSILKAIVQVSDMYGGKTAKKNIPDADLITWLGAHVRMKFRNGLRYRDAAPLTAQEIIDNLTTQRVHDDVLDKAIAALEKAGTPLDTAYVGAQLALVNADAKGAGA